jgi:hypothetical protein
MGKTYTGDSFKTTEGIDLVFETLKKGGYTGGTAQDLENQIVAAVTGVKGETLTPSSAAIGGTGVASFIVIEAGTYTNNGGFELPIGNIGVIARNASDVLSFAKTTLPLADYAKIVDVVLKNDLDISYTELGNNIIDRSLFVQDTGIGTNGIPFSQSGSTSIVGQPITGGTVYTLSGVPVDSLKVIGFMNSSNVRVGGERRVDASPKAMTAPSDAVTVNIALSRLSESSPTQYQLEVGNAATPYVEPQLLLKKVRGAFIEAKNLTANNEVPAPTSVKNAINLEYFNLNALLNSEVEFETKNSLTNFMNRAFIVVGSFINSDGSIGTGTSSNTIIQNHPVADYVSKTLFFSGYVPESLKKIVFRNSSGTVLEGVKSLTTSPISFIVPFGAVTFDMSVKRGTDVVSDYDLVQFNKDSFKTFEPFTSNYVSKIKGVEILGGSGGESYDQSLNSTDDVFFNSVNTSILETISWKTNLPEGAGTYPAEVEIGDAWLDTNTDNIKVRRV